MRNLKTVAAKEWRTHTNLPLTATAWDARDNSIICAFGPTTAKPVIELKRKPTENDTASNDVVKDSFRTITSWDAPCPLPDLDCDEVLHLQYFSDTATSCLILAGGDLILVREEPLPDEEKIEIVGSVDVAIAAAQWAPDEQLLAILTRTATLILMSRTFEVVDQATLTSDDLNASKHVSVGWGKKETQFHGKRARALRDPTVPDRVDEGKPSDHDDRRASISWRGDGAFLAVNSIMPDQRRVIRVFTREAVLDSASEPVDGLESALRWRPHGNIIAGIQRLDDRIDVVFFERNGLRHGEFSLRLSAEDMRSWASSISLSWNIDSSVLAVAFLDRVQFWTMNNYHYYMKQNIYIDNEPLTPKTPAVRWHTERSTACCISSSSSLSSVEHRFDVCRGSVIPTHDHGIVAVVDGRKLKLTPLKHAAVPPPMAFAEILAGSEIVDCTISKDGRKVILLTMHTLEIYDWKYDAVKSRKQHARGSTNDPRSKPGTEVYRRASLDLLHAPGVDTVVRYTHVALSGSRVYVLGCSSGSQQSVLQTVDMEDPGGPDDSGVAALQVLHRQIEGPAALCTNVEQTTVWAQTARGTVGLGTTLQVELDALHLARTHADTTMFRLPHDCENCAQAALDQGPIDTSLHTCSHFYRVSLSPGGTLTADQRVIARGCTSYIVTDAYLVFTTSQHLLKLVHLTKPEVMEIPGDTPEVDERCRSIERGAILVTVIPSSFSVVLQMPRGNLETIHPRVLVLSGIRQHITSKDYRAAFLACQTHQVDLNILCDYQQVVFMDEIPAFIAELKKVNRIDEFLSKLKDEDVSQTLYRDTLNAAARANDQVATEQNETLLSGSSKNNSMSADKVNRICNAFISHLSSYPERHLQNLITAHVCKRPPDLKTALSLISGIRQTAPTDAEEAISHMCFLTDTNRLYDAALSLYDLQLTLMVAQNSQRDPREYLPFLQSLHSLPELRRKYTIDNHLKNYTMALNHLHALSDHTAVEAYTTKHAIYLEALELYKYDRDHLRRISGLYAQHLASTSQHSAAATLNESLGDYSSAYPLYALAHRWRESLSCASLVPLSEDQLRAHALSLATTLSEESRDYRAAATIHSDYLSDHATAARLLCKSSYFAEASRVLSLHHLSDLIPEIIDTGLSDKFGEMLELLSDCRGQLGAQIPRIQELRKNKAEDPLGFFGGNPSGGGVEDLGGQDVPDNVSLAPTDASTAGGQSLFTRYGSHASTRFGGTVASGKTHQTCKTKRREERKRARGKKGSVYEEEYLVASVKRLVERVNGIHEEVGRLVDALMRRSLEGKERASVVTERMAEVVRACEGGVGEVWGKMKNEEFEKGAADTAASGRPSGADGVLWDAQQEMDALGLDDSHIQRPKVHGFKSSPLLHERVAT